MCAKYYYTRRYGAYGPQLLVPYRGFGEPFGPLSTAVNLFLKNNEKISRKGSGVWGGWGMAASGEGVGGWVWGGVGRLGLDILVSNGRVGQDLKKKTNLISFSFNSHQKAPPHIKIVRLLSVKLQS